MSFTGSARALTALDWFVLGAFASAFSAHIFSYEFFEAHMLSTRFGYGRPAFSALALAAAFCPEDSGLDFLFGFFFFQGGVVAFGISNPMLLETY